MAAALHTADREPLAEGLRSVARIVERVCRRLPRVRIILRGASGFCRDELLTGCEQNGVNYVFGLARNAVLERLLRGSLRTANSLPACKDSDRERVFKELRYRAKSWGRRTRRVVGKAGWSREGANPRHVITNRDAAEHAAQPLYETVYCGRGNMENRIQEQQRDWFAGPTSTERRRANQLRRWFSLLGYLLVNQLRRVGLAGTQWAQAPCGTLRTRRLQIAAWVQVTARRVRVSLSGAFALQEIFALVARRLAGAG